MKINDIEVNGHYVETFSDVLTIAIDDYSKELFEQICDMVFWGNDIELQMGDFTRPARIASCKKDITYAHRIGTHSEETIVLELQLINKKCK